MNSKISVSGSPALDAGAGGTIAAVLLDIEGTVSPVPLARQMLLYARRHLGRFLDVNRHDPVLIEALGRLGALAPGAPAVETLEALMDRDATVAPLETIQGMILKHGFTQGALRTPVHPEAAPLLRRWRESGLLLFGYASAPEAARCLLLRHTSEGDLSPLFSGVFGRRLGAASETSGYAAIRAAIDEKMPGKGAVLLLSASDAELAAAAEAGLATCRIASKHQGGEASRRHGNAESLHEAAVLHGLLS